MGEITSFKEEYPLFKDIFDFATTLHVTNLKANTTEILIGVVRSKSFEVLSSWHKCIELYCKLKWATSYLSEFHKDYVIHLFDKSFGMKLCLTMEACLKDNPGIYDRLDYLSPRNIVIRLIESGMDSDKALQEYSPDYYEMVMALTKDVVKVSKTAHDKRQEINILPKKHDNRDKAAKGEVFYKHFGVWKVANNKRDVAVKPSNSSLWPLDLRATAYKYMSFYADKDYADTIDSMVSDWNIK